MEQNLKVLAVVHSDAATSCLAEVFARQTIAFHRAPSGAAALILTGNSLYDLLVIEDPLTDLPVDSVLSSMQSFEWASAGTPALVITDPAKRDHVARRLEAYPVRTVSSSALKPELRQAVSELLGVPVRSSSKMMVNVEVRTGADPSLKCFQSENISESGMLLKGAQTIPIGTPVRIEFSLPDEAEPVRGTALVVRHTANGETPGVGLRFVELNRAEIARLRRFVDRTLSDAVPSSTGNAKPRTPVSV